MKDLLNQSAADLGRAIDAQEIDPIALTENYLSAITDHPQGMQIYSHITNERAMAEAKAASLRAKNGTRKGLLDGVPISWKDLIDVTGAPTEAGSKLLAGNIASKDAQTVVNATANGSVCLGKTHLPEFAFSGLGINPNTATPPNINYPDGAPGGSSSGAAASVAFGLAAAAIGSDTGGSVRVPSAWNDLVGLKTTHGLISTNGVTPLCSEFDTIGPMCRTVEDAALVLGLLENKPAVDISNARLDGLNFAVLEDIGTANLHPSIASNFENAISILSKAGAKISTIRLDWLNDTLATGANLFAPAAYAEWAHLIDDKPELMFPFILERFLGGKGALTKDYLNSWRTVRADRNRYNLETAEFEAVLMPTTPNLPPNRDQLLTDKEYYDTQNMAALRNTRVGNVLGLCALTLPSAVPSSGIMFMGAPFSDHKMLRIGAAAEGLLSKTPR